MSEVRRSAISLICAHTHAHSATAFLVREFERRMTCCDKYASIFSRHAHGGDSPNGWWLLDMCCSPFQRLRFVFPFVEVHFFILKLANRNLSKLSMLNLAVFQSWHILLVESTAWLWPLIMRFSFGILRVVGVRLQSFDYGFDVSTHKIVSFICCYLCTIIGPERMQNFVQAIDPWLLSSRPFVQTPRAEVLFQSASWIWNIHVFSTSIVELQSLVITMFSQWFVKLCSDSCNIFWNFTRPRVVSFQHKRVSMIL